MNGNKTNAHAGMPFCGMLQFVMPTSWSVFGRMTKGNSPFGAWVVCVYRSLGMLSLKVVNATICAFFCFHKNWCDILAE